MGKIWADEKYEDKQNVKAEQDENEFPEQFRTTQLVFHEQGGKKVPKLKEPRNLYALTREKGLQTAPRWPVECHVTSRRPRHIYSIPQHPEPFYTPGDTFSLPPDPNEVNGNVVYDNPPTSNTYFLRSRVGGNRSEPKPYYNLQSVSDNTLIFESRFESGNLMRAVKIDEYDYHLWLQFDMYTNKHTQWFYFRVQNTKPGVTYRFTILNFMKSGSLYNSGMRPLLYSEHNVATKKIGWIRVGENIKYYKNNIRREDTTKERYYYSLTWSCQFPHENDTCYFAHCYPYTYSDLQEYLHEIGGDPQRSRYCKQRVMCRTLAGNFVYLLTITNPSKRPSDSKNKRGIVITARVHPGETNSSWMMKGLLDYLTSNTPDAKLLRDVFIFKIVPMLNPDGVVVGNYRCSLTGRDLNRNYTTVLRDSFPSVWHTRTMIAKLLQEREIVVYCDLHGHSRKKNVFMYACEEKKNRNNLFRQRVFPMMMSKNASSKFSFKGCKFRVQKSKEGTGRIVMWNMGIMNSFTMEATFSGSALGEKKGFHFSPADFESMSYHLCDTLLDYCDPDDTKVILVLKELELLLKSKVLERMKAKGKIPENFTVEDIDLSNDYTSDIESSTGGSDSSVSDGLPMHLVHAVQFAEGAKKKKLKTRKERNRQRDFSLRYRHGTVTTTKEISHSASSVKQPIASRKQTSTPHNCCSDNTTTTATLFSSERTQDTGDNADYLEAVTNACLVTGLLSQQNKEIPHLRYTAGKAYLQKANNNKSNNHEVKKSSYNNSTSSQWSCPDHGPHGVQGFTASDDEDGNFTFSYLVNHLDNSAEREATVSRLSHNKSNHALDLARQITSYNHRQKDMTQLRCMKSPTKQFERSTEGSRFYSNSDITFGSHVNHRKGARWPEKNGQSMMDQEQWSGRRGGNEDVWNMDKDTCPNHLRQPSVNKQQRHSIGSQEMQMDSSLNRYQSLQRNPSKLTSGKQLKPLVKTQTQKDRGILLHSAMFRPADSVRRRSSLSDDNTTSPLKNNENQMDPIRKQSSVSPLNSPEKDPLNSPFDTIQDLKQKLLDSEGVGQLVSHALYRQLDEVERVINDGVGSSGSVSEEVIDDEYPTSNKKKKLSRKSIQSSKHRTRTFPDINDDSSRKTEFDSGFMRSTSFHNGGESFRSVRSKEETSDSSPSKYTLTKTKSSPDFTREEDFSGGFERPTGVYRRVPNLGAMKDSGIIQEFREFHSHHDMDQMSPGLEVSSHSRPIFPPSYMNFPRTKYTGAEIVYKSHVMTRYNQETNGGLSFLPSPVQPTDEQLQDFGTVAQRAVIHPPKSRRVNKPKFK